MPFHSNSGRPINGPPEPLTADKKPVSTPRPPRSPPLNAAPSPPAGLRKLDTPAKATQADTISDSGPAGIHGAERVPANAPGTIAARKIQSFVWRRPAPPRVRA